MVAGGGGMVASGPLGGRVAAGGGGFVAGSAGGVGGGMVVAERATACGSTEDCAAACVCAGERGPAVMTFVGNGCGDYITETSYKYVGFGQGNLSMVAPGRYIWGRLALLVSVLVLVVVLIILLWPPPPTTSTTIMTFPPTVKPPMPHGECTFWGDPHLKTFDDARPSFYGEGEAWVVKTATIKIQARYLGTQYTKGLAATSAIAVGGSFLKGHVIIVGTMDDGVLIVDGQSVLPSFGRYNVGGVAELTYSDQGNLVDAAAGIWEKHVVRMDLPEDVQIEVFRWSNYIDLRIKMPKRAGIDGACGNFNGNAADDSTRAIQARVGVRVGPGELLFQHRHVIAFTAEEKQLLTMCDPANMAAAESKCPGMLRGARITNQNKACYLDYCYGSNEHTLRYAKGMGL